ncbi:MAG: glycosyltransferase family 2 protein [Anaerolineaceae bacterium]|nr:glycosyltransferase family 2 protein [Anaerolineaceae bacterium]
MEPVTVGEVTRPTAAPHKNATKFDFKEHKVVVIIPVFNEERFIGSVLLKTLRYPVTVIVVDDGSEDDSASIAARAGAIVLQLETNQGKGAALNRGFHYARELEPDVVVVLDGDGQHLPEELPRIIQPVIDGEADIVVGSRYIADTSNTPPGRRLGHQVINLASSVSSGVAVSDSQSGFRAFSPKAYRDVQFSSNGFSVESEMQFYAHEHQLKVVEVPITIRYLDKAKRPAVQQGMSVLNGILKLIGQYRPLLFFSVPGSAMVVTGIGWGILVLERYNQTHQLATGYTLICVLLTLIGTIMISTGFMLHSVRGLLLDIRSDLMQRK